MTKTGTALLNGDRSEELKRRVWEVAQGIIQKIDDGTIDEEMVADFEHALNSWMVCRGSGLSYIYSSYWEKLVEMNEGARSKIREMIHDGLDCYSMEFWPEEDEDSD